MGTILPLLVQNYTSQDTESVGLAICQSMKDTFMPTNIVVQKSTGKNLLVTLCLICHHFSALYWLLEE